MENILISFTANTGALDEINQKLATVKQNMAGIVTGGGSATPGAASTAKGTTDNSEKQRLDETRKATSLLIADNKKLMKDYDDLSKKYQASQSTIKASATDTKKSIDALSVSQKKVNEQIGNKAATESFREQMKKLKYEIIALDMAGQNGSETYKQLVQKAGEMNDAMGDAGNAIANAGSDTQSLDAIIAGTELIAGGFSVATGAAALFGVGTEDVARMQVRLQSAIAITTGLQSVGNAVQRDGALIQGIVKAQLWARATAEKLATSGTWAGVAAQKAFNLVAMANPYVLMAVAIMTVVGAIWAWNKGSDDEIEKQKQIADLEALRRESLDRISQKYKTAGDEREKYISNELELLKASGAAQSVISKKESELLAEKLANATEQARINEKAFAALDINVEKVNELKAALEAMNDAKLNNVKEVEIKINNKSFKVDVDDEKLRATIQTSLDNLTPDIEVGFRVSDGLKKANQDIEVNAAKNKVEAIKNARSEAIATAEIKLIEAKKGSAQELIARIGVIAAQRQADIESVDIGIQAKRLKIEQADKAIAKLKSDFNIAELEEEKSAINTKLLLSKVGSQEELTNKKELLSKQMEIELANTDLSANKQAEIRANYLKQQGDLMKEFNDKKSTEALDSEIRYINADLAMVMQGTEKEYQLRVDLIEMQAALERKQIDTSLDSEETKLSRIYALNAKAQKEINDLTYERQTSSLEKNSASQTLALSNDYANGLISKSDYEAKKEQITINSLKRQVDIEYAAGNDGLAKKQELADKEIALKQKTEEAKAEAVRAAFDTIGMLGNALMDGDKSRLQQQLSDLDYYYTTDVEAAKKNKDLKYISEKEMNKKQLKLKQEIAKADKKQAVFNVIMSTIQAVAGMLASKPIGPWNWALAAITAAQGAIQIAAIQAQPLPKYWKGKKGGSGAGEMAWVGEQGPEIMYVPNGASIMPAGKSNKVRDAIGIMREYNIPVMPHVSKSAMEEAKANGSGINYDLLANKIGDQMEKRIRFPKMAGQRPVNINVDHSGTSVTDGDTTTHYRNRKYVGNV